MGEGITKKKFYSENYKTSFRVAGPGLEPGTS